MRILPDLSLLLLGVLLSKFSMGFSRRISETKALFLSSGNETESTHRTKYRKLVKQPVDCSTMIDSPKHCPYMMGLTAFSKLSGKRSKNSISPWVTRMDYDPSRLPQAFPVVCCSCLHCVRRSKNGQPTIMPQHYSKAVYIKKKVYRPEDGFRPRFIKVSVGCTCVYRPFGI
ncbi:uncharacterized protein LOC120339861 [Styela clava]|uniref:uncharacterized protein LOC120339861 n=1 Tax=Styela clava TaxID=7725 RepID=UPI0019396617|nr:uncharacterized protein LOC120339861 [Styela clava]